MVVSSRRLCSREIAFNWIYCNYQLGYTIANYWACQVVLDGRLDVLEDVPGILKMLEESLKILRGAQLGKLRVRVQENFLEANWYRLVFQQYKLIFSIFPAAFLLVIFITSYLLFSFCSSMTGQIFFPFFFIWIDSLQLGNPRERSNKMELPQIGFWYFFDHEVLISVFCLSISSSKVLFFLNCYGKNSFFSEKQDYARFCKKSGHKKDLAWSCKILQGLNH